MESLFTNRIEWFLDNKNKLPHNQWGFRKSRGVQDTITYVSTLIANVLNKNQKIVVIFIDISAPYDNVVIISKLIEKLTELGISSDMTNLIFKLMREKNIYVRDVFSNKIIGPKTSSRGLPQGSSLSPLLFNTLYTPHL